MKRALQYCSYAAFRTFEGAVCLLPLDSVFRIGGIAGRIFGVVASGYRKLVARNLRTAFGEKPPVTPQDVFARLGANLFAGIKVAQMSAAELAERVEMVGLDRIPREGAVIAICHLACWEIVGQLPGIRSDVKRASLFQPLGEVT